MSISIQGIRFNISALHYFNPLSPISYTILRGTLMFVNGRAKKKVAPRNETTFVK